MVGIVQRIRGVVGWTALVALLAGCSLVVDIADLAQRDADAGDRQDSDTAADIDHGTEVVVDAETEAEVGADGDTDADSDADADAVGDADGSADGDADSDADARTEDGGVDADDGDAPDPDADTDVAHEDIVEVDVPSDGGLCGTGGTARMCEPTETCCLGTCVDTTTDLANCGGCGNICDTAVADRCVAGGCRCGSDTACRRLGSIFPCILGDPTGPQLCCDAVCRLVTATDCGLCGNVCPSGTCNGSLVALGDRCLFFCS